MTNAGIDSHTASGGHAKNEKVVVTGGGGFIGSNLVRALRVSSPKAEVVVLDDFSTGNHTNLAGVDDLVQVVEGSILDPQTVEHVVQGATAVVHLAARPSVPRSVEDPVTSHRVNVDGTLTVLEAIRRQPEKPYVIFASSSSVYGANPVLPKSEGLVARPMSPYAASKLAAEQYLLAYQATYGLEALAFRFFNVFGPRQPAGHAYAAVIPAFLDAALHGRPLTIHGDGTQTRDFTYVGTVCDVICDAISRRVTQDMPVNLAFGSSMSLLELARSIEAVLGVELQAEHLPFRKSDIRASHADGVALRSLFPDVSPVDFQTGLKQTADWMTDLVSKAAPREHAGAAVGAS